MDDEGTRGGRKYQIDSSLEDSDGPLRWAENTYESIRCSRTLKFAELASSLCLSLAMRVKIRRAAVYEMTNAAGL